MEYRVIQAWVRHLLPAIQQADVQQRLADIAWAVFNQTLLAFAGLKDAKDVQVELDDHKAIVHYLTDGKTELCVFTRDGGRMCTRDLRRGEGL